MIVTGTGKSYRLKAGSLGTVWMDEQEERTRPQREANVLKEVEINTHGEKEKLNVGTREK